MSPGPRWTTLGEPGLCRMSLWPRGMSFRRRPVLWDARGLGGTGAELRSPGAAGEPSKSAERSAGGSASAPSRWCRIRSSTPCPKPKGGEKKILLGPQVWPPRRASAMPKSAPGQERASPSSALASPSLPGTPDQTKVRAGFFSGWFLLFVVVVGWLLVVGFLFLFFFLFPGAGSQRVLLRVELGREERRLDGRLWRWRWGPGRRGLSRGRRGGEEGGAGGSGGWRAGSGAGGLEDGPVVEKEGALLDEEFDDCLVGAGGRQGVHRAEVRSHQGGPEADGEVLAGHQVHPVVVADPAAGGRGQGAVAEMPSGTPTAGVHTTQLRK